MSQTKVSSVRVVRAGNAEGQPLDKHSHIQACSQRWEHLRDEVRTLKWSECPEEMVADFVKSVTKDLQQMYGDDALSKALQALSCAAFENSDEAVSLSATCSQTGSSISLNLAKKTYKQTDPAGTVEMVFHTDAATPDDARQRLKEWGDEPSPKQRTPLNVFEDVSAADIRDLVRDVEGVVGNKEIDVLFSSSFVLQAWDQTERMNASDMNLALERVTRKDKLIGDVEAKIHVHLSGSPEADSENTEENLNTFVVKNPSL